MDRNVTEVVTTTVSQVALRKESVDRNYYAGFVPRSGGWSLSARRAWIEMLVLVLGIPTSVSSLSARRAWIEIDEQTEQDSVEEGRSPQGERG